MALALLVTPIGPTEMSNPTGVFAEIRNYPDLGSLRKYQSLVGLDDVKQRLLTESILMLDPARLRAWSKDHHSVELPIIRSFQERPPLFLFGGDVGTGKTALAETVGDAIARSLKVSVTLFPMTLSARGTGTVGEMTNLITQAFAEVRQASCSAGGGVTILMIDEADALAQSREAAQMHHEDRAGVNAIIRGLNELTDETLKVLVIMCTNRLSAIDPAIQRRAAATFQFNRPNDVQRSAVIKGALGESVLTSLEIDELIALTGPTNSESFGFTYSDLTQRFLPTLVTEAFPDRPITLALARKVLESTKPTRPFTGE